MKKDLTEEKQKLGTDNRNNEEVQKVTGSLVTMSVPKLC